MKYIKPLEIKETSIENFEAWSYARNTLNVVIERGDCDLLENLIDEWVNVSNNEYNLPTDVQINDFLCNNAHFIYEELGYQDLVEQFLQDLQEINDYIKEKN